MLQIDQQTFGISRLRGPLQQFLVAIANGLVHQHGYSMAASALKGPHCDTVLGFSRSIDNLQNPGIRLG